MEELEEYLVRIDPPEHQQRMRDIHDRVQEKFPQLVIQMKWNQPMFTDHGTYIIAFSTAKKHLSVAPEKAALNQFSEKIARIGYPCSKELIQIPWTTEVDFELLEEIIEFNITDKADYSEFWR